MQENNQFNFEKYLKEIKQDLIISGYSEKTLKIYILYIKEILNYINKKPEEINERDLIGYLAQKKENGCSNTTLALIHA
ncbi:MAG: phage integrase N-terminal SAM-like domain-containing protein, partial [Candidatus ainarchaeum sp.]|nr:phage integrase N-terminal SAM-like domain-containing protein [Candidatus ainarchaeum sp.]